jgi:nucleoside-diphosphate-sugar epimerase
MLIPMKDRRITLIGGAGFIGHNLALELKSKGADVHIIDGLQVNNLGSVNINEHDLPNNDLYLAVLNERLDLLRAAGIPVHVQDARDYHALSRLLSELKPQVVVQLAAVSHANRSNKDPHSTFDHSLRTLENALDSVRKYAEHFLFMSSSMVYGNFETDIVDENSNCNPIGIYGALKFSGEKIVTAYNQVFDLPYTIIRPSALYGERCISRRVGQIFIEHAILGQQITVNGDGSDKLDFTYIKDLVDGISKCIENPNSYNEIFNLTFGNARSISEMLGILGEHFPNIDVNYVPKDKLMPERGTLSGDKARQLLDYTPQHKLDTGYVDYINWYKEFITEHPDLLGK